jgi:ketosteroid isomerase-like protein
MSNAEIARKLFAASEALDAAAYADLFADDAVQRIDNHDPIQGKDTIRETAAFMFGAFAGLKFNIKEVWDTGDAVICPNEVTFLRKDGKQFTFPRMNIFRIRDGKIQRLQTFGDVSPAFHGLAPH